VRACELDPVFGDLLPRLRACEEEDQPLFPAGDRIVAAARRFARSLEDRARFARAVATASVNPVVPPVEPGIPKATLFAGDTLYAAGFAAPVRGDGYLPVATWPHCTLFQPVGALWARPGDLLIIGVHIEVITEISGPGLRVATLGARAEGLVEDRWHGERLRRAERRADHFVHRGQAIHVLRVTVQAP
jgi:hypothetical protein